MADPEKILARLIRIAPANTGGIKEIIAFACDLLTRLGYKIIRLESDGIISIAAIGNNNTIAFQGHLDVVPMAFGPKIAAGKIIGRGACDMLGSIAAILSAIKKTGIKPLLLFSTDEETGHETGFKGAKLYAGYLKNNGIMPEIAINMEPSDFNLVIGRKGAFCCRINTFGKSSHGSMPEKGDNAIVKMSKIIAGLNSWANKLPDSPLLGKSTLNIGKIYGGVRPNIVPDLCIIEIDFRANCNLPVAMQLAKCIESLGFSKKDYSIELSMDYPPSLINENSASFARLKQLLGNKHVIKPAFAENYFLTSIGIPTVTIGGPDGRSHSDFEFITKKELAKLESLYLKLLRGWAAK